MKNPRKGCLFSLTVSLSHLRFIRPLQNQSFLLKEVREAEEEDTKAIINQTQTSSARVTDRGTGHCQNPQNSSIMVDANNVSLQVQQPHQANPTLQPLFHALDPISLILNQNSGSDHPVPLRLACTESFVMERGPRYEAYAELRETKLRRKCRRQQQEEEQEQEPEELELKQITPPRRKQVKFQAGLVSGRKGSSVVAQSVPDLAAALRKENRKPLNALPSMVETTPPSKSCFSKGNNGVSSNSRGSKSANAGEKKRGGAVLMARKSYASIDELRGLSLATANAISGEARGGRRNSSRVMGKTVSGYRQF